MLWRALYCVFGLGFAGDALACAVCGFGAGESQNAFLLTTGLLTFVPLMFIGGVVFYLWRRHKSRQGRGLP